MNGITLKHVFFCLEVGFLTIYKKRTIFLNLFRQDESNGTKFYWYYEKIFLTFFGVRVSPYALVKKKI